jgi:hypothetical protein
MKPSHNKAWVRQDRVFWIDEDAGTVEYKIDDAMVSATIQDITVWAPASTRKLADELGVRLEKFRDRIFTHALREWQVTRKVNFAIEYLNMVTTDLKHLRLLDWHYPPAHAYTFNARGPLAMRYFSQPGDDLGCKAAETQAFARVVSHVGRSYGGTANTGAVWFIEAQLENMPEYLDSILEDIDIYPFEDFNDVHTATGILLQDKSRTRCEECGKWIALTRSDIKYCSQACTQRAYRKRKKEQ